jgi:hypothetical protein
MRRLQYWYSAFNEGRELRCMQLFVRLLHEMKAAGIDDWWETPLCEPEPPPATSIFGFNVLVVKDKPEWQHHCR